MLVGKRPLNDIHRILRQFRVAKGFQLFACMCLSALWYTAPLLKGRTQACRQRTIERVDFSDDITKQFVAFTGIAMEGDKVRHGEGCSN